eukprot:676337-Pleurochrysis_carterae.AAC.1
MNSRRVQPDNYDKSANEPLDGQREVLIHCTATKWKVWRVGYTLKLRTKTAEPRYAKRCIRE